MLFRTTDTERWGAGIGRDFNADEIDRNFWELLSTVNDIIANPGAPVSIASITGSGNQLTFHMSDGSTIGPIFMPVLQFHWRDVWTPTTLYETLDVFRVVGMGLYMVLQDHISLANFDPNLTISSEPAYLTLFEFAPVPNSNADIGFYYPGLLSDISSDVSYLYQEPMTRRILLPATALTGSTHQAYLQEQASVSAQDFNVYQNDVMAGSIHFAVGSHVGSVTLSADITFEIGARLAVSKPLVGDATAGGFSAVFAAQQILK